MVEAAKIMRKQGLPLQRLTSVESLTGVAEELRLGPEVLNLPGRRFSLDEIAALLAAVLGLVRVDRGLAAGGGHAGGAR